LLALAATHSCLASETTIVYSRTLPLALRQRSVSYRIFNLLAVIAR